MSEVICIKWFGISLGLLLLATFSFSQDGWFEESCGQVWRQTDWSGWPSGMIEDTNSFEGQRDTDWWSSPGELKLSCWIDIWIGKRYPLDSLVTMGISCLLELPNGELLGGGAGHEPSPYVPSGGIFRSTNHGETWTQMETGFEYAAAVQSMVVTKEGDILVSVLYPSPYEFFKYYSEIWKSRDLRFTWERIGGYDEFGHGWLYLINIGNDFVIHEVDAGITNIWEYEEGGWRIRSSLDYWTWFPMIIGDTIYLTRENGFSKSTDYGYSWEELPKPNEEEYSYLIPGVDGASYASDYYGLYKTYDFQEWEELSSPFDTIIHAWWDPIFQSTSGTLYLGGVYIPYGKNGQYLLFSSANGKEWKAENIYDGTDPVMCCYFEDSQGNIFVGLRGNPYSSAMLYKKTPEPNYNRIGWLVADIYDTGHRSSWGRIDWDATLNGGKIKILVRTDTVPQGGWGYHCWCRPDGGNWSYAAKGRDLSNLPNVHDGDRYIGYVVELYAPDPATSTPVLREIQIEYGKCTDVEEEEVVEETIRPELLQNHPNPFSQSTAISYQLSAPSRVSLRIYDTSGRVVATLVDEMRKAGFYTVFWDGKDEGGKEVSAGVYFYQLETQELTRTKKLVVVR